MTDRMHSSSGDGEDGIADEESGAPVRRTIETKAEPVRVPSPEMQERARRYERRGPQLGLFSGCATLFSGLLVGGMGYLASEDEAWTGELIMAIGGVAVIFGAAAMWRRFVAIARHLRK